MASSVSVSCPKTSLVAPIGFNSPNFSQKRRAIAPFARASLSFGSSSSWVLSSNKKRSAVLEAKAQAKEMTAQKSPNCAVIVDSKSKVSSSESKEESAGREAPDAAAVLAFMSQASDLIKLVNSRDIVELKLKQSHCELVIRKREALQPAQVAAPTFVPPLYPQPAFSTPPPPAPAPAPSSHSPSAAPALSAPAKASTPSHPPMKCPMAGNFYRSPAPGAPPFVKVGDKVQKGQVICIIEAMKLMNEIEAEQSGTVIEILADEGKPVSVDTPLFVIVP